MQKPLKPSMREKKRYLLLSSKPGKKKIDEAILEYIGALGYSQTGLMQIKDNIIAVNREVVDKVKAALLIKGIKVKKVSGSVKNVK